MGHGIYNTGDEVISEKFTVEKIAIISNTGSLALSYLSRIGGYTPQMSDP
jgi:hypothetical protein